MQPQLCARVAAGFHYYKRQLEQFEDPAAAFARRGAHWTFDAQAYVGCIRRIKEQGGWRNIDGYRWVGRGEIGRTPAGGSFAQLGRLCTALEPAPLHCLTALPALWRACPKLSLESCCAAGEALVPSFDHGVGDPVEDDIRVTPSHRIVLSEGNYLLLGALACVHHACVCTCAPHGYVWHCRLT